MKIKINYKSGISETILCESFEMNRDPLLGLQLKFDGVYASPKPFWVNEYGIESIWDLT